MQYVAFLRGINIGRATKMEDLRRVFESLGYDSVRTVQASGNVLFETRKTAVGSLVRRIEQALAESFGYRISVLVRTREELERLVEANPFASVTAKPGTRTHVTFVKETAEDEDLPRGAGFEVLGVFEGAVCSVVHPSGATTDLMRALDKGLGTEVTTRTWKTIERIAQASA